MAGVAGAGLGAALVAATPSTAADFNVTNLDDAGSGSLRAAVEEANAAPGADRILFQSGLSGSIELQSPLDVTDSLNVEGPAAGGIILDGNDQTGIFAVGAPPETIGFELSNLTLRDGYSPGDAGGAILAYGTDLDAEAVRFEENRGVVGGAIYATYESDLTISNSTFSRNISTLGGGIMTYGADVRVSGSTFDGNQSLQGGGAIASYATPDHPELSITNSTMSRNSGGFAGGAIFGLAGQDPEGELTIESSTISGNMSSGIGGGVGGSFAQATVGNSVIENNFAFYGPDLYSAIEDDPQLPGCGCYPETTFDTAFSFIGNTDGALINPTVAGSNILDGGDALLGRLVDNGGPTRTMAIGPESPVTNKGASALTTDQRGELRPVVYPDIPISGAAGANGADMGAFELQYVAPPPPPPPFVPNGPFVIVDSTPNRKQGTAIVRVKVPAAGRVDLLGFRQLKRSGRYFAKKGTYRFKAVPKGNLRKKLNKRGRARMVVRFKFNPDRGRTLAKGRRFPLFKDAARGKKSKRSALRVWRSLDLGPRH